MRSRSPRKTLLKASISTPDIVLPLVKELYRKHKGVDKDYRKKSGLAYRVPNQVSLRITNVCNHRCSICGQYGEKSYVHQKKELFTTLPFEKYKQIVDEMAPYKPIYYVTGGEAFLYPDLVKLINYVKKNGSVVSVVTNGVKLKECAEEIVRNGWDMILVSFDGPEEVHDKCRGLEGAYKTAVDGIAALKEAKQRLNKKKPYILTSLTLSKTNAPHLEEAFEVAKDISPYLMVIYLSWFTSKDIGDKQTKLLKDQLDIDPYTWKSYAKNFTQDEAQMFSDALDKIRRKKWPFPYIVLPDLKGEQVRDYYLHPDKMFGYNRCAAPFFMIDIMPNGDVVTCRDFIDIRVGNIMDDSLLNIWNNDKFVRFRKLLIEKDGLLPQCSRCCGLMGF